MELWAQGVERSVAARESAPATATFHDFDYRDLIATPAAVVERIRRALVKDPEPLPDGVLRARVDAGQKGKPHRYEPEWFGLDRGAVAERFAGYTERFGLTSPAHTG